MPSPKHGRSGGAAAGAAGNNETSRMPVIVAEQANARFKEATQLYQIHEYHAAVTEFTRAIFLNPKSAEYYAGRGKAYRELCDFKSALVDFRMASNLAPTNEGHKRRLSGLFDMVGHLCLEEHAYSQAKEYFTMAIQADRLVVAHWLHRAVTHVYLENWRAALADADHAIFLAPRNADAHVLRAKLYWKLGMLPQGNAEMHAAVTLNPQHPEVIQFEEARWTIAENAYQRAASLMLVSDTRGAILELNRALELAPDDVKTRVLRAAAYREEGNYAESLRDIEYAARAFREQLREERAASESPAEVSEAGKKATEEALDAVEHPEISRQRNITLNAVAVLQHQRGNYAHALTLYNKVIQSETSMAQLHDRQINHRFLQNRGDTYLATGNLQQALSDYHRAYDSNAKDPAVHRRLGVVHDRFGVQLFNDGSCAQAEVEFSTAIQYNPNVSTFYLHRGNAQLYLHKNDFAYKDFRRALQLDPNNLEAAKRLQHFGAPPGVSDALVQTKVDTLTLRTRSAAAPRLAAQRPMGGRRGPYSNIWDGVRQRELERSGALTGWLESDGRPRPRVTIPDRDRGRKAATPTWSGAGQSPRRRAASAPSTGMGLGLTLSPSASPSPSTTPRVDYGFGYTAGLASPMLTRARAAAGGDSEADRANAAIALAARGDVAGVLAHNTSWLTPEGGGGGGRPSSRASSRYGGGGSSVGGGSSSSSRGRRSEHGSFPPIATTPRSSMGAASTTGWAQALGLRVRSAGGTLQRQRPGAIRYGATAAAGDSAGGTVFTAGFRAHDGGHASMHQIRSALVPRRPGASWVTTAVATRADLRSEYYAKSKPYATKSMKPRDRKPVAGTAAAKAAEAKAAAERKKKKKGGGGRQAARARSGKSRRGRR